MFEHLLREMNSLSSDSVNVSIPTDADGPMFGRAGAQLLRARMLPITALVSAA